MPLAGQATPSYIRATMLPPRRAVRRLLLSAALATAPVAARAQFGLDRALSNISVANVNAQWSCLTKGSNMRAQSGGSCGLYGWGLELAIDMSPDTAATQYQFALGYGQITGFASTVPSMDVHGVMKLQPEASLYITRKTAMPISPYLGVHTGLVSLSNIEVYTVPGDTSYSFSGSTLQFGLTAGLSYPFGLYSDVGYRYRNFQSLDWKLPHGTLPDSWPKNLVMSALQFTVGMQFNVGRITGKQK